MSDPATAAPAASGLLATIETDLKAGVSFLEQEAELAGVALWNVLKTAFIALEPAEANILVNVLTAATTAAAGGKSIEEIEAAALNDATAEEKAVLGKAGSGVIQQVIAGIKANTTNPPATAAGT